MYYLIIHDWFTDLVVLHLYGLLLTLNFFLLCLILPIYLISDLDFYYHMCHPNFFSSGCQPLLDSRAESIEEMACVRRKTRSSVGTRMKDKLSEHFEISDKTESQESETKYSEDNVLSDVSIETVSMVTRRQTRKSLDDTCDNKSTYRRSCFPTHTCHFLNIFSSTI
jgi:hypothetical protein